MKHVPLGLYTGKCSCEILHFLSSFLSSFQNFFSSCGSKILYILFCFVSFTPIIHQFIFGIYRDIPSLSKTDQISFFWRSLGLTNLVYSVFLLQACSTPDQCHQQACGKLAWTQVLFRAEERRVGKECRSRW